MEEVRIIDRGPRVYLAGITLPTHEIHEYLNDRGLNWTNERQQFDTEGAADPTAVIEYGGRISYESWNNAHRRSRGEYIQSQLIGKHHGSTLEHLVYNLIVADVPRSVQMETIRHRAGTAYSWTSQRYVDKSLRFIVPPAFREDPEARERFIRLCESSVKVYERLVDEQLAAIAKPTTMDKKRAREAARGVLPNAMASDGVFTLNAREARHFIQLRTDATADQSMREFAYAVFVRLREATPAIFEDAIVTTMPMPFVPEVKFQHEKV